MATDFDINQIMTGALVAGYSVAALFFLRFWRKSRERLFAFFATAFGVLALQRLLLGLTTETTEDVTYLYALRLAAFLIILWGIIEKNREP